MFDIPKGLKGKLKSVKTTAQIWTLLWLLLAAAGYRPSSRHRRMFRCSPPLRVTLALGTWHCGPSLNCNPLFLEWLMGWPIGWTDAAAPVTGFSRWLRRSRTELSRLLSTAKCE